MVSGRLLAVSERDPNRRFVFFVAAIAALAGGLFGYDTGIISGAILFIRHDFSLSVLETSFVVSSILIGAILGSAFASTIVDRVGRRKAVILAAIVFGAGAIWTALSPNTPVLVAGRVVTGLAIGLASSTAPVYISEVAPAARRGTMTSFFQLATTVGMTVSYLVAFLLAPAEAWRIMLILAIVPALLLGIGMFFMPPSPRWLIEAGRIDEARRVLKRLLDPVEHDIETEIADIRATVEGQTRKWSELLAPGVKPALFVGLSLAVLQQVTGINTVLYYAPTVFQSAGLTSAAAAILAQFGVGIVFVITSIVAINLIDRVGRRPLLLWGLAGMTIGLGVIGLGFAVAEEGGMLAWIAVGSLMFYVAAFAFSLGPVFWLMNAEIYPLHVRGRASSLGSLTNWSSNFVVTMAFLPLVHAIGESSTFWLFAVVCVFAIIWSSIFVPETKDKTLEEIEQIWTARAERTGRP